MPNYTAKRAMTFPEAKIQTDIIKYLQLRKIYALHIPNERKATPQAMGRLIGMGLRKGAADLEIFYPNHGVDPVTVYHAMATGKTASHVPLVHMGYIEVKAPGGKQSDAQKRFEYRCIAVGIPYDIAYSVEDVEKILKKRID